MDPDTDVCQTEQPQISYSVDFTAEQISAMGSPILLDREGSLLDLETKDRELLSAPTKRPARNGHNSKTFIAVRVLTPACAYHGVHTPAYRISQNRLFFFRSHSDISAAVARATAKAARQYAHTRAISHSVRENTLTRPAVVQPTF